MSVVWDAENVLIVPSPAPEFSFVINCIGALIKGLNINKSGFFGIQVQWLEAITRVDLVALFFVLPKSTDAALSS